jgi:alkylation response protein AidB-like acyl-CoA dehydrogenase
VDLTPTPEQEAFRAECRAWLAAHPYDDGADDVDALRAWQRDLAAARLVGVTWPTEYGGRGAGPLHHYIAQEELARAAAPELIGRIGVNLVGPTLLAHGTDEQRARWLPRILDAGELWCQLFSEPDAGSDLAGLKARAAPVDGGYLLTGSKVWTSHAHVADWGLCLARTDPAAPKHKGISALVVDMRAPGVEVRPLVQLTGDAEFNEVFFDDVFVPVAQRVGAEHEGWRVSSATLTHERGTNPRQLVIHVQRLDQLLRLALERGVYDDHRLQQRVAEAYVEVKLFQLHNWRSLSRLAAGRELGPEGSVLKLYWSEMSQRLHETAMAVLGPAAPLWRGATDNPGDGRWQRSWLYYRAASIFAGTNEIQRNIVGERVLGLPR